jgi:UDP-N-acetylmuramate--alanine ligase
MEIHDFKNFKHIHFVGIGGIGISAIAKMMCLEGKTISGSDMAESPVTEKLRSEGVLLSIGHRKENVPNDTDLIIYTIAIPENNPELLYGKERGIPMLTYPEALGVISKNKKTIAISGTHGKTTTTAMIAGVLKEGSLSPTVVVGSFLKGKDNFIAGTGDYLVVEACEYRRSFLNLSPYILVITNIDEDHLDYYKDLPDIQEAFAELIKKVPKEGAIVCDPDNENVVSLIKDAKCKILNYRKISLDIKLQVPGEHNVLNAKCALAVSEFLGIKKEKAEKALSAFAGTWRRQEYKGKTKNGALVYDDYAHHPTEIAATLSGFREKYPDNDITIIFQPHLYSRTHDFFNEFAEELSKADYVIIAPIYAAREKDTGEISGKDLADEIAKKNKNVLYIETFSEIEEKLLESAKEKDIIITMGAGDIYKIGEDLLK